MGEFNFGKKQEFSLRWLYKYNNIKLFNYQIFYSMKFRCDDLSGNLDEKSRNKNRYLLTDLYGFSLNIVRPDGDKYL